MKFLSRTIIVAGLLAPLANAATLTVVVSDISSAVGTLNIAIYDNKQAWLGDDVLQQRSLAVADHLGGGSISASFELEPGNYAVSVHHDNNGNGQMDTNFIGIPREPTGLSNGAVPKFGPPQFKDAVFSLPASGVLMPIKLLD